MSAQVLKLPVKLRIAPKPEGERFFCTRCDSASFVLLSTSRIHCSHCNAAMKNIFVERL